MYLAVLDFLNVWLGDNTIQLFGSQATCLSNRRGVLSNSRTHLFLNKFDLAVHVEYMYCMFVYILISVSLAVYSYTYVCLYNTFTI